VRFDVTSCSRSCVPAAAIPTTAVRNIAMAWVAGTTSGWSERNKEAGGSDPSRWTQWLASDRNPYWPNLPIWAAKYYMYWAVLTWIGLWTRTCKSVVAPVTTRSFTSTVFNETLGSGDITSTCAFNAACVEQLCFEEKESYETANSEDGRTTRSTQPHFMCATVLRVLRAHNNNITCAHDLQVASNQTTRALRGGVLVHDPRCSTLKRPGQTPRPRATVWCPRST